MALYIYLKADNHQPKKNLLFFEKETTLKLVRILPYFSIILGVFFLLVVAWPMISYQLLVRSKEQTKIITPVPQQAVAQARGFVSPQEKKDPSASKILSAQDKVKDPQFASQVDLELIENWFPSAPLPRTESSKITHYNLSIPQLKIENAIVTIGGQEIKETLIHYPGTALPGEYGNTVIFGHSVLPIFNDPKDYKAIFSLLPTLEKGNKIYLYFDGIEYVYQVEDYFEVQPEEIRVLEQRFNEQTLSLITCVPPGTYKKRGVVKARLLGI